MVPDMRSAEPVTKSNGCVGTPAPSAYLSVFAHVLNRAVEAYISLR